LVINIQSIYDARSEKHKNSGMFQYTVPRRYVQVEDPFFWDMTQRLCVTGSRSSEGIYFLRH